jgi:uncharacterized protein YndB with AHSA1/START domain
MAIPVIFGHFTIERSYPAPPERVFRAFTDPVKKRRWFAEGEGFTVDSYALDFRVDGFERCRFRFGDGPLVTMDAVYLDILTNERIAFAYSMTLAGAPMSSSLGVAEFVPSGTSTLLRLTEHTAFVDGKDGSVARREGSLGLLEALAKELEAHG